jgi:hypothetical protein
MTQSGSRNVARAGHERWPPLFAAFLLFIHAGAASCTDAPPPTGAAMQSIAHLHDYQVVEFRRYGTAHGERARFAAYFDAYFPDALEQLGAMVFGQFLDRDHPDHFTWLRGFKDLGARPIVNSAFYYGPVWKEHRTKVNAILPDSDNVMLLRPLHAERGVSVLPAVDPVDESGTPRGIVVAQIFPVKKGSEDAFAMLAETAFERYRIEGVREAGVLVTLDVPNNFPQLPIRGDGPWLVWIGVVKDAQTLATALEPRFGATETTLAGSGLLRAAVERLIMNPTPRSRLRWLEGSVAQP